MGFHTWHQAVEEVSIDRWMSDLVRYAFRSSGADLLVRAVDHGAILIVVGTTTLFGVVLGASRPGHVPLTLPNLVKFLETTEGRDKWYRTMQYLARAISFALRPGGLADSPLAFKDFKEIQNSLSDARKITKFSLQPKELYNLTIKNRKENARAVRYLLNIKAFFGIIMICFQNAEWLINHKMMATVDSGARVGRSRGFFWAIMCVAGLGADICSLVNHSKKAERIRQQLRQNRLPAPSSWGAQSGAGRVGRGNGHVHPLAASRSHDTLASKWRVETQHDSGNTAAHPVATGSGSLEADEFVIEQTSTGSSLSGLVPSRSLVDVAAVVAGRPVSGALNWTARLERRALKAQLSVTEHKRFAKRLSLHKNLFDLICATNTAYGSGLIFKQYTDLVIGLAGFYSSVLGAYRAWLTIFPWTPNSQKVPIGNGLRSSLLRSPRPLVAETPVQQTRESKLPSVAERAPSPRKLSRAVSEGELLKIATSEGGTEVAGSNEGTDG